MNEIKTDIINTNYIFEHPYCKIWNTISIGYGFLLIVLTSKNNFDTLINYKSYISIGSTIVFSSYILLMLVNFFLFTRVGTFSINDEEIHITHDDDDVSKVFKVSNVKSFAIENTSKKFYAIKIDDYNLTIELKKEQAKQLESMFSKAEVSTTTISLLGRLRKKLHF